MKEKEIASIVGNRIEGYLESAIENYPMLGELFGNSSTLRKLLKSTAVKGVLWYLQELWHDASEEPDKEGVIIQYLHDDKQDYIDSANWIGNKNEVFQSMKRIIKMRKEEVPADEELEKLYHEAWKKKPKLMKWCYLDDIKPKKGNDK